MAKEDVKGVSASGNTIKALKEEIKQLRKETEELTLTSSEWQEKSAQLAQKQSELSAATAMTKGAVTDLKDTYSGLVQETNELRRKWRVTPIDSEEFKKLTDKIDENNAKLKELDASIGDYYRNVGNYAGKFAQSMNKMGISLGGVMPMVGDLVEGVMGAIEAFGGIKEAIGPALTGLKAFVGGLSGVKKAMLASGIGALVVVLGLIAANWDKITAAFKRWTKSKAEEEIEKTTEALKALNNEIAEGGRQMLHRTTLLKAMGVGDATVLKTEMKDLKKQVDAAEILLKQAKIDATQKYTLWTGRVSDEAKAQAQKNLEEAQRTYDELNKQYQDKAVQLGATLIKQKVDERNEAKKTAEEKKKIANAEKLEAVKIAGEAKLARLEDEQRELVELSAKYAAEKKLLEKYKKDTTDLTAVYEAEKAAIVKKYADERQTKIEEEARLEAEALAQAEANSEALRQILYKEVDDAVKGIKEESDERKRYIDIEIADEEKRARAKFDIEQKLLNDELALLEEELNNEIFVGDKEVEVRARVAQLKRDIAYNEAAEEKRIAEETARVKKEKVEEYVQVSTSASSAISGILGSIADMYEADAQASEDSTRRAKAIRIAGATIDMLSGITSALSGLFTTKSGPWDIALAGAQAAAIGASGMANIAKIKAVDFSGASSIGAAVNAPSIIQQVPAIRTLTGVAEEAALNQAQRVYVVYDDIAQAGRKTEVTQEESTF